LLRTLGEHFTVQYLTTPAAAKQAIAGDAVRVIIAIDKTVANYVQPLLARGGTVVFAGLFSSFTNMSDFDATFKSLGLPWVHGSYYR
jgi:D-arabinose 1-dehydrogenase-like Zn-dependent alcohol dehydrogenase